MGNFPVIIFFILLKIVIMHAGNFFSAVMTCGSYGACLSSCSIILRLCILYNLGLYFDTMHVNLLNSGF